MKFTTTVLVAVLATLVSAQSLDIPARNGEIISLSAPEIINGSRDFDNQEYDRGRPCNSDRDSGSAGAVFILQSGASISNVIIGPNQLEGVHCRGSCTLKNVWFRDVCEDAITLLGTGNVLIQGGGAANARDKVIQHNGKGTVTIKDYTVVAVGTVFRSCGNCSKQDGPRSVTIINLTANGVAAAIAGINSNYGDVLTISGSCGRGVRSVCQEFEGLVKSEGKESPALATTENCKGAQGALTTLPAC